MSQLRRNISYLCTYDLYGPVHNAFDAGSIHYEGKWEGVGPWKLRLFWAPVKWHRANRRVRFGAQKSRDFQSPTPSHLSSYWMLPASKALHTGLYELQVHRWFYVQEPTGDFKGVSQGGFRAHTTPPVRIRNITALVQLSNITGLLPPPSPPSRTYLKSTGN